MNTDQLAQRISELPKPDIRIDAFGDILPTDGRTFVMGDYYSTEQMRAAQAPLIERINELEEKNRKLEERCSPNKVVMIGDAGHYVSEGVGSYIEELERQNAGLREDAEIGQFFMSLAKQNSATSWPRLWKIEWCGYAQTREADNKLYDWALRDAICVALASSQQQGEQA